MKLIGYLFLLVVAFFGCDRSPATLGPILQSTASDQKTAAEFVASWGNMGMYLPDHKQVVVFRNDFANSSHLLRDAILDKNHSVRMRSAYVIGQIGSTAKPMGDVLLARLEVEPKELVRMYIVTALSGIGYDTEHTVTSLTTIYESLNGRNVRLILGGAYSEVDRKINVASALFILKKPEDRREYFDFVTKWLDPPDAAISGTLLDGYWERRWMAVNSLERMPEATDAIVKLEKLQHEPGVKPWVKVHAPRVLAFLRKSAE